MIGLRRRRGVIENVTYFDNDDELEKKKKRDVHIHMNTIKTFFANTVQNSMTL